VPLRVVDRTAVKPSVRRISPEQVGPQIEYKVRVDAALFFVLFGVCLVVHELGALSRGKRIAAEHPGVEGMRRRKRLIIQGVWYAMVAVLIIAWWFGSVFAGEMLFLVFVITALVAALTVLSWLHWALRATLRLGHR
jgi:hypothetical protein